MKIGYARVSTQEQDLALQFDALNTERCERIFQEKASGAQRDRPELKAALTYMRKGDTLVAVAESFFQLLKRERIRRRIYADREQARQDVFDYIEMFYNPTRRHGYNNSLSPVEFEKQYFNRLESV